MGAVSEWAGSILSFLILITVIRGILPSKKYEPYLRLFSGLMLILLVLQPVTGGLGLEKQIDRAFEAFAFQMDHEELNTRVLGIEKERQEQILKIYENDVAGHVTVMAGEEGIQVENAQVEINGDPESTDYGKVVSVKVKLQSGGATGKQEGLWKNDEVKEVQPVQNIEVQSVQIGQEPETGVKNHSEEISGKALESTLQDQRAEEDISRSASGENNSRILEFQRKVERYYGLESGAVEIQS